MDIEQNIQNPSGLDFLVASELSFVLAVNEINCLLLSQHTDCRRLTKLTCDIIHHYYGSFYP